MTITLKPEWTRPGTILFASEVPANEKAFAFALAQAHETGAELVLFHAYDTLMASSTAASGIVYFDYEAAASNEIKALQPLAERAREAGVPTQIIARPGLPADRILEYAHEHKVDRIVMATHSPGPIGKLLVGSVAEAVLRNAEAPVFIVGPETTDGTYRNFETRTVLCAISSVETSGLTAQFAAEVAAQHNARLVLEHVIRPQDKYLILAHNTVEQIENAMLELVPGAHNKVEVQAIVVPGDPAEELLFQSRAQHADLIVLGAHGASAFAAISRTGVVYKVLAHAHCPVMTLSPCLLGAGPCGAGAGKVTASETYLAGVI